MSCLWKSGILNGNKRYILVNGSNRLILNSDPGQFIGTLLMRRPLNYFGKTVDKSQQRML